ncbi:MAG: hypothetical protein CMM25_02540 [Rhodospirillaceae bacterium]|nr:hypothetical protein [Rhodospirillaceae bacterium]|tara:strand:+ start:957 stop:1445 length:489 start_codon:yes stop_codon:yes gene_type:complete
MINRITIISLFIIFTAVVLITTSKTFADTREEAAKNIIWEKEKAIYNARPKTGLDYYIENASPNYKGWPPGTSQPSSLAKLKKNQRLITIPNSEVLKMYFDDFTLHDNTGVIYYHTHRTRLPNGKKVDQHYHIAHVWIKDKDGDWKILGAMGRLENNNTSSP